MVLHIIQDMVKPRLPEATTRLRHSIVALFFLAVVTHLLPTPSIPLALYKFLVASYSSPIEQGAVLIELAAFSLFMLNIVQASWAISFPRKPSSTPSSASARLMPRKSTEPVPNWQRASHGLSPNTTPQRQRPFSTPTTSDPRGLAASYSLPYVSPAAPGDSSFDASFVTATPSPPPLASFRGRRSNVVGPGRPLDESILARLNEEMSNDDD